MEVVLSGNNSFFNIIKDKSGQSLEYCYQCQKCAAGCTMAADADYTPNQILRMVQMGLEKEALQSSCIWLCSGCETCGARCPNGINIGELMDALKETAIHLNFVKEKNINLFNNVFLENVRSRGRIHEAMMMAKYKLKSGNLFSDLNYGISMFIKGKMPLLAKSVRDRPRVRKIFDECKNCQW